jgi:hypothetical protein
MGSAEQPRVCWPVVGDVDPCSISSHANELRFWGRTFDIDANEIESVASNTGRSFEGPPRADSGIDFGSKWLRTLRICSCSKIPARWRSESNTL